MRPLSLTISGLQSFRDERTIDFAQLTERGLFGIFGPTGSGKSTILDAITLALYGIVERSEKGRIATAITTGADRCRVCFTFVIRHEEAPTTFTVERSWKINPSGTTSKALLMRHEDGDAEPIPIAEKAGEVTDEITRILGIEQQDFSRTVILPQGAFADFLGLTEKDRGTMLRRIFGLEELGYRIDKRSRELQVDLEQEMMRRDERLAELRQYDDTTLEELRTKLVNAEKIAEKKSAELTDITRRTTEAATLLEQIVERTKLQLEEKEQAEKSAAIESEKKVLERADAAAEVAEIVAVAERAVAAVVQSEELRAKTEQKHEKIVASLAPLRAEKEKIEKERAEGGRIARLSATIELLATVAPIDERITVIGRESGTRQSKVAETSKQQATKSTALDEQRKRFVTLNEEIAQLESTEKESEAKLRDVEAKKPAITTLLDYARRIARLEKESAQKEKDQKESEANIAAINKERTALDTLLEAARKEVTAASDRIAEIERTNAAALLMANLTEGKACPLCGSRDHPLPYHATEASDLDDARSALKRVEEQRTTHEGSRTTLSNRHAAAEATGTQITARLAELTTERTEVDGEIERFLATSPYQGAIDVDKLTEYQTKCATLIVERTQKREEVQAKKKAKEEERTTCDTAVRELDKEVSGLQKEGERESGEIARLATELTSMQERRIAAFTGIDLDPTEIPEGQAGTKQEELKRELAAFDRRADEVMASCGEAEKSVTAIERDLLHAKQRVAEGTKEKEATTARRDEELQRRHFTTIEEYRTAALPGDERERLRARLETEEEAARRRREQITELTTTIGDRTTTDEEVTALRSQQEAASKKQAAAREELGGVRASLQKADEGNKRLKELEKEGSAQRKELETVEKLRDYVKGNRFVDFLASDRLRQVCRTASTELRKLSNGRLEITVEPGSGFVVIDHGNGGNRRPTRTLSGGETFLVSLSLALALSESLQSRGAPLDLFFLDEGFGTLDAATLETVLDALERIRRDTNRIVGLISHVEALQERIPRRLVVKPATVLEGSGVGTG